MTTPGAYALEVDSRGPSFEEWMMGWPVTWTRLTPLETGRFQSWQQMHL